jgi:hypothetical protein
MSSVRDEFRRDTEKRPEELEREIDRTRAHMEHTLDLLERKLSPGELIDELLNMAKRNGFTRNLSTQVQNNPLPTLLTGVGLAWLMASSDRPPPRYPRAGSGYGYGSSGEYGSGIRSSMEGTMEHSREAAGDMAHRARDRARDMGERAQEMGHQARESMSEMGHRARDAASQAGHRMHDMADSVRNRARGFGHAAARGRSQARMQYQQVLNEQPLLLGALGLALGAALGALAPRTETEDELMGEYSERAKREARREGERQYERVRDTAERVAGAAKEEISEQQGSASQEGQPGQPQGGSQQGQQPGHPGQTRGSS